MARKHQKNRRKNRRGVGSLLKVNSARGRKVRANTRVTMPLKSLRRMLSAARRGAKTTIKAVSR
jgi:hypothetical protein